MDTHSCFNTPSHIALLVDLNLALYFVHILLLLLTHIRGNPLHTDSAHGSWCSFSSSSHIVLYCACRREILLTSGV